MTEDKPPRSTLKVVRNLLWVLVAVAVIGTAAMMLLRRAPHNQAAAAHSTTTVSNTRTLGGPFTLVGADRKPFSSSRLAGKPYAIYFGFTRCGDVCPTTLSRLVKLRQQAGSNDALNLVFVTIDPKNDGPKEVGQYSELFGAPIIGLTGSEAQIDRVKKQYGIFAQPSAHPMAGKEMEHTATVLLFDAAGKLTGTISPSDADTDAVAKLRNLIS